MARIAHRSTWIFFLLLAAMILLIVGSGEEGPIGPDSIVAAFATANPDDEALSLRMQGTLLLVMVVFGAAVLLAGFRRRRPWSWWVAWYYPVFFLIHVLAFGVWMPDGIFVLLGSLGLLSSFDVFYPRSERRPSQAARS